MSWHAFELNGMKLGMVVDQSRLNILWYGSEPIQAEYPMVWQWTNPGWTSCGTVVNQSRLNILWYGGEPIQAEHPVVWRWTNPGWTSCGMAVNQSRLNILWYGGEPIQAEYPVRLLLSEIWWIKRGNNCFTDCIHPWRWNVTTTSTVN